MSKQRNNQKTPCDRCLPWKLDHRCEAAPNKEGIAIAQKKARETGRCDFIFEGFCADPTAWQVKRICDDCIHKAGGSCDVFTKEEDGDEAFFLNMDLVDDATHTDKCEFYKKNQ